MTLVPPPAVDADQAYTNNTPVTNLVTHGYRLQRRTFSAVTLLAKYKVSGGQGSAYGVRTMKVTPVLLG